MKKLKYLFTIIILLSLFTALWANKHKNRKYEETEFMLDTVCTVTAYGSDAKAAVTAAFERIAIIHSLTDFYSETSDVSRLNRASENEVVQLDPSIIEILACAQTISQATNGEFDVTIAPVSKLWDFKAQAPSIPDDNKIKAALSAVNYENLIIDTEKNTVTKLNKNTMIDLGSAAKGYAGDEAARLMKQFDIRGAIIDLGGNIVCFGKNPESENKKWRIGLQTPFKATGEYSDTIELSNGAVVTSGTYQRSFTLDGIIYHHLLSTKTGYPKAMPYSSVSVSASSALTADLLSTACFLLGEEEGSALAAKYDATAYYQK